MTTTTTTSTTPATTTTTTCPSRIVTSGTGLPVAIPDDDGETVVEVEVSLPVELNAGCGCTVANVAIAIGINHPNVGDLGMGLISPSPDNTGIVFLVDGPPSTANLVAGNKITFDDSVDGALDPRTLWGGLGDNDPIPAGTYFAQGLFIDLFNPPIGVDPVNGLVKFNDLDAGGDWRFLVVDGVANSITGTLESVELTITCE